ncbi:MAG: HAMP domain-containing sensor histidine kinase [Dehalobacterium sp.]
MKKSISSKLYIWICGLGIFFIVVSWLFNAGLLQRYYLSQKKLMLFKSAEKIESLYHGDPWEIQSELKKIESEVGGYVFIISPKGEVKYSSFFTPDNSDRPHRTPPFPFMRKVIIMMDKFRFDVEREPVSNTEFLSFNYLFRNRDRLSFVVPLAAVAQSVAIANRFFFFTGIFVISFGFIVAFLFSRKFTRPILNINEVARNIANLDFSRKCQVNSDDEIGELADSINFMSEDLERLIDELNQKNRQLEKDIERERQIDEMRKEFISNVSHELKTPISLIQGYAEGLKVNVNEDEENKNFYCDVIVDEALRMDTMVKELLNLCQLESDYVQLKKSVFDLSQLIDRVADKYRSILQEKQITLQVEKDEQIYVEADKSRIEQVLVNYINNAIQYTDLGKRIEIHVKQQREKKIRVSVYNTGNHIPEEYLEKIWISFYKVDKARTRIFGGTGLGLSIVRGIMELHQNSYGVENAPGGVCFWFELDAVSPNSQEKPVE